MTDFKEWWAQAKGFVLADIEKWSIEDLMKFAYDSALPKWQPIDSAPLDGESVLLYYGPGYYAMEGRCFKRERGKNVYYQWVTAIDMGELEPSHWMPLPNPPK